MRIVLVTGGFDPLHSGHIEYLRSARKLGDELVVGLNSDSWLARKKGKPFMPFNERLAVLSSLRPVDWVINFDDDDGSACQAIYAVREKFLDATIVFANGGDRTEENIPEMQVEDDNIEFVFGVGGEDKINSSSWILEEWKAPKTSRPWGYYRVLHEVPGTKVKELTLDPGQSISLQKHDYRAEYWHVSDGEVTAQSFMGNGYALPATILAKHQNYKVPIGEWHKLTNHTEHPVKIVEIQFGSRCDEEDITRK